MLLGLEEEPKAVLSVEALPLELVEVLQLELAESLFLVKQPLLAKQPLLILAVLAVLAETLEQVEGPANSNRPPLVCFAAFSSLVHFQEWEEERNALVSAKQPQKHPLGSLFSREMAVMLLFHQLARQVPQFWTQAWPAAEWCTNV